MFSGKTENEARQQILDMLNAYCNEFHQPVLYQKGDSITYAKPVYDGNEMCNALNVIMNFRLAGGEYTQNMEAALEAYLAVPYCSLVNSGSSANYLAISALTSEEMGERRVKPGDEIITVAAGFPTTVAPIVQCGAVPVFVDVSIPFYNLDVELLEQAFSEKTKGIMVAHTLGNPFDLEKICSFCEKHNLWLIEDNCDALGSEYFIHGEWKKTGTIGDIGTSSFYPAHHITMGEGGAVYTKNPQLHKVIRSLRDWGRDCVCACGQDNRCGKRFAGQFGTLPYGYDHKYVYSRLGYNLKPTDIQAAIGLAQMEKLPQVVERRRENWKYLKGKLEDLREFLILPEESRNARASWFSFVISVRESSPLSRYELVSKLEEAHIQTRPLFAGNLLRQPCFASLREGTDYRVASQLSVTDQIMNHTFLVGVHPAMTKAELDEIAAQMKEAFRTA